MAENQNEPKREDRPPRPNREGGRPEGRGERREGGNREGGRPEGGRQHEFVMLRARLAYTIARHSLRSLDGLERLLLQVTRKNDVRGYERFKDLFEAIIAYNE